MTPKKEVLIGKVIEQIKKDFSDGDVEAIYELLNFISTKKLEGFLPDTDLPIRKFYYEIHVTGKEGFSTSVISHIELDDDDVVLKAYADDKLHDDDCHYVDYVKELTEQEWNEMFNY